MSFDKLAINMVPKCLPIFQENEIYIKEGVHAGLLQVCDKIVPNTLNM